MDPSVIQEQRFETKGFTARFTLEWFDSGMRHLVPLTPRFGGKRFAAHFTTKHPVDVVRLQM